MTRNGEGATTYTTIAVVPLTLRIGAEIGGVDLRKRPEREQLAELSAIVARHGGFVVSDEIHAPLTHRGHAFTPYLTVSDEVASRVVQGSKDDVEAQLAHWMTEGNSPTVRVKIVGRDFAETFSQSITAELAFHER